MKPEIRKTVLLKKLRKKVTKYRIININKVIKKIRGGLLTLYAWINAGIAKGMVNAMIVFPITFPTATVGKPKTEAVMDAIISSKSTPRRIAPRRKGEI